MNQTNNPQLGKYIIDLEDEKEIILKLIQFCKPELSPSQLECYRILLYFLGKAYQKTEWGLQRKTMKSEFFKNVIYGVGYEITFAKMLEMMYIRLSLKGNLISPDLISILEEEEAFVLQCLQEESRYLTIKAQQISHFLYKYKKGELKIE